MTETRWRMPAGVRTTEHGHNGRATADLFVQLPAEDAGSTHPDFAARAEIWRLQREGVISIAEASRRSAAVGQAVANLTIRANRCPAPRPRHSRPAPRTSRQYAPSMSTEALRDDRLTPGARAFLVVLRARCGKGRSTAITKGTAGSIMSRSTRTIRRYLVDLIRFGYVETEISRTACGLHVGLVVRLFERCFPFFEEAKGLARWLTETPAAVRMPYRPFAGVFTPSKGGVTLLSPKNHFRKDHLSEAKFGSGETRGRPPNPPS